MTLKDFFPRLFSFTYRATIRKILPVRKYVRYNNVNVEPIKALDRYFSYFPKPMIDIPDYEDAIVDALDQYITRGDIVVVIGGGYGVSVVKALQKIGVTGQLFCYEGSKEYCRYVRDSISYNEHLVPENKIVVANNFVGSPEHVYGSSGVGLPIEKLPVCDVLELDCEGAEKVILSKLLYTPRIIIVETHGLYGASTKDVKAILCDKGYVIVSEKVAERNHRSRCLEEDIMVLVGIRKDA